MSRGDDRAGHELPVRPVGKDVDEVHRKLFRIVVDHNQIAEVAEDLVLIGFDLHLRRLLFRHFSSVGLQFKLSQVFRHALVKCVPGAGRVCAAAAAKTRSRPCASRLMEDPGLQFRKAAGEPVLTALDVKCSLLFPFI
jgi:hypothetical protein